VTTHSKEKQPVRTNSTSAIASAPRPGRRTSRKTAGADKGEKDKTARGMESKKYNGKETKKLKYSVGEQKWKKIKKAVV
jgi:hypothetical protein